ncbi:DNA helicase [Tanacetum coccineum]
MQRVPEMTHRLIWIWVSVIDNVAIVDVYFGTTNDSKALIKQLLKNTHFMKHIRAYNQMFLMTSFGAKIDHSVNRGRGPYVFKISGQIYHWIGFLFPEEGTLNPEIVEGLIHVLAEHNGLVRLFGTAHDRCNTGEIPGFKIRLYNMGGVRGYKLPTANVLGGIVFEDGPRSQTNFDVIIELKVSRGDREGIAVGSKIMLQSTFTGGPRYMYNHYLDALAICRSLGNSQFFITFTCNVKWPEFKRYMAQYSELTPTDRPDIIDEYISAERPDPVQDPRGHKLLTELMMHGPYGATNLNASCMQNGNYSKHFPKQYNDKTFFDSNGYTYYQRRDTGIHVMKGELKLDNCNVIPYNRALCLAFEAHINVKYYGWSMLIKYLFKYISKGPDRILTKISNSEASTSVLGTNKQIDEI